MVIIPLMDAFFPDPDVERLPPEAIRLLDLRAEPYPDGRRIRIGLNMTPFLKHPNIELTLTDPHGRVCASAQILEPMNWKLELTLHIRTPSPNPGTYTLTASLSYPEPGETDRRQVEVNMPAPS